MSADYNLTGLGFEAACALSRIIALEIERLEKKYKELAQAAKEPKSVLGDPYFVGKRNEMLIAIEQLRDVERAADVAKWNLP